MNVLTNCLCLCLTLFIFLSPSLWRTPVILILSISLSIFFLFISLSLFHSCFVYSFTSSCILILLFSLFISPPISWLLESAWCFRIVFLSPLSLSLSLSLDASGRIWTLDLRIMSQLFYHYATFTFSYHLPFTILPVTISNNFSFNCVHYFNDTACNIIFSSHF